MGHVGGALGGLLRRTLRWWVLGVLFVVLGAALANAAFRAVPDHQAVAGSTQEPVRRAGVLLSVAPPRPDPAARCGRSVARSAPPAAPVVPVVAVAVGAVPAGGAVERRDTGPGAWAVVVRRKDGSLGRHGAVITFPVTAQAGAGRPVMVSGAVGSASPGQIDWPVGGTTARIRGDLRQSILVALAAGTTLVAGRPVVRPPSGYAVTSAGPYRSRLTREVHYLGGQLADAHGLHGTIYAGVTEIGGFEDQLYATAAVSCGTVHGQPAVLSTVLEGNGTLGWQVAPGLVGYVGYSGSPITGDVLGVIEGLAARTRYLGTHQWHATGPRIINEANNLP